MSPRKVAVVLALIAGFVLSSCARGGTGRARNTTAENSTIALTPCTFTLPAGDRAVAFDALRNSIWVLTQLGDSGVATGYRALELDEVNLSTQAVTKHPLPVDSKGWTEGVVHIASDGSVWLGWGFTVARFDPTTATETQWAIPKTPTSADTDDGITGHLYGMAVSNAGDKVWVLLGHTSEIEGLTVRTGGWSQISLPSNAIVDYGSEIAANSDGSLQFSGYSSPGVAQLFIAQANNVVTPGPIGAQQWGGSSPSVILVNRNGQVQTYNKTTETTVQVRTIAFGARPNDPSATDAAGNLLLVDGRSFVRISPNGAILSGSLPLIQLTGKYGGSGAHYFGSASPPPQYLDPDPQGVVGDGAGQSWIFLGSGGPAGPQGYASCYHT